MMTILRDQEGALRFLNGAKALVSAQNREIRSIKQTLITTQNELESWRTKYHNADKNNTALTTMQDVFVGIEIVKLVLSAVGVSLGVNLITNGNNWGYAIAAVSVIIYGGIT